MPGPYHKMGLRKNDMVVHEDHRGRWRVDLLTSATGNFLTIGPTTGYADAQEAAAEARREHHKRGLRNGLLYKQRADGSYEMFYWRGPSGTTSRLRDAEQEANGRVPMKANGIDWERSAQVEDIERDFSGTSMAAEHPDTEVHIEHGQPWVTCLCGASWSVVDTSRGLDYERIDEGDDGYHMEPNGRATTVDTVAARELDLYIGNTWELVGKPGSIGKSIDANLKRKVANGTYDSALATKAWQHLVDQGAKRYEEEFGDSSPVFNAATRRQVAADFAAAWEDESGMQPNVARERYWSWSLRPDNGSRPLSGDTQAHSATDVLNNVILRLPYHGDYAVSEQGSTTSTLRGRTDDLQPNARRVPESLQPYSDFSNDELYDELRSKGYSVAQSRLHAKRASYGIGKLDFIPPRVPPGWTVSPTPIFRKRDAKVAFEAHKGAKYMVFDQSGKAISPELRAIRGLLEWRDANGWVDAPG